MQTREPLSHAKKEWPDRCPLYNLLCNKAQKEKYKYLPGLTDLFPYLIKQKPRMFFFSLCKLVLASVTGAPQATVTIQKPSRPDEWPLNVTLAHLVFLRSCSSMRPVLQQQPQAAAVYIEKQLQLIVCIFFRCHLFRFQFSYNCNDLKSVLILTKAAIFLLKGEIRLFSSRIKIRWHVNQVICYKT